MFPLTESSLQHPTKAVTSAKSGDGHGIRQAQLIDAAITAIFEHGLSGVTLAKVAGRASLTAAMVNFHFTSKEALLLATLQHLADEYQAAIEAALAGKAQDPAAALSALVETRLDPGLSEPRKVAVWYAFWGEMRARTDYMALCGARDAAEDRRIAELNAARAVAPEQQIVAETMAQYHWILFRR